MDIATLVRVLFDLIVAGIFLAIVWVVLKMVPAIAPFKEIIMLIFALICVVVLFNVLSPLIFGGGGHLLTHGRYG